MCVVNVAVRIDRELGACLPAAWQVTLKKKKEQTKEEEGMRGEVC